ncbi:MAG: putative ABC exporter domain-containing protein, partial [Thiohalocapsa sp.]
MGSRTWLHPALWTLLALRIRGGLRRSLRELRKLHRAAAFLFGVSIIGLAVSSVLGGDAVVARLDPGRLGALFQSGLLGFLLVGQIKTLGDKAVYFSPSEVDFLFSGPFTRRELLTYRVLSAAGGVFVLSALLTILFASIGAWWPAVFVGAALSFLFIHQLAMCLATVRETVEAHAYSLARRIAILSVVTLVIASIVYGVSLQSAELSGNAAFGVLNAAYGTWTMRLLLAPFVPFAEIVSAQAFGPETIGWIAVCVAINAATFAALARLD